MFKRIDKIKIQDIKNINKGFLSCTDYESTSLISLLYKFWWFDSSPPKSNFGVPLY